MSIIVLKTTMSNSVFISPGKNVVCIKGEKIPSCCHYMKICCGHLVSNPRNITGFLFLNLHDWESVSVSPGEGVPSPWATKILHTQGLHFLWTTFSCAISQPKTTWRSANTVNLSKRTMCLKKLM